MQNAHLRLGRLEYRRNSGKTDTKISVHVDRYVGEGDDAHLISLFGGDCEVGAITAAIHEKHTFTVTFLDGSQKVIGFGPDAICYRGSINLQGRKHALRHLIAVSTSLNANGSAGRTFILHLGPETRGTRMGNLGELSWVARGSALERSDPGGDVGGEENSSTGWNRLHAGSDPRYTRRIAGSAWAGTISGAAAVS
jgi:hypothetical protein